MKIQTLYAVQKLTRALQLVVTQEDYHFGTAGAILGASAGEKSLEPAFTHESMGQCMLQKINMAPALEHEIGTTKSPSGAETLAMAGENGWK
ncbi:hypothetical protein N7490_006637 [Penicillium lividum]|nr:hypothetical protein N7490_006637 [Penicillium lividum]